MDGYISLRTTFPQTWGWEGGNVGRKLALALCLAAALLVSPLCARADYNYSFTTGAGSFSFTQPTLLQSSALPFSFTPFTLGGFTFTQGIFCALDAFAFATSTGSISNCGVSGAQTMLLNFFPNQPNTTGTFAASGLLNISTLSSVNGADASLTITAVPEPSSLLLLGTGALALVNVIRKRVKA